MAMLLLLLGAVRFCLGGCDAFRSHAWTFSLVLVGLWVATMPSPAEGLCWESGLLGYQSGLILDLVLLGILLREPSWWCWGSAALMGLCSAGCPETTVGLLGGALGLGIVWTWGTRRATGWLIGSGALVVGFLISAAAPGNLERVHALRSIGMTGIGVQQVLGSLEYPTQQVWYALNQIAILAAALGSALWGWMHAELLPGRRWLLMLAAVWLTIIGGVAPALIVYNGIPGRADNTIHLAVMLGVFVVMAGLGARLKTQQAWLRQATAAHRPTVLSIALLVLGVAALQAVHDGDTLQLSIACLATACLGAAYRWRPAAMAPPHQVVMVGWALACCLGCYLTLGTFRQDLQLRAPEWNPS